PGRVPVCPWCRGAASHPVGTRDRVAARRPNQRSPPLDRSQRNGQFVQSNGGPVTRVASTSPSQRRFPPGNDSSDLAMIYLNPLATSKSVRHAFFTREGGVSEGLYASLNCGFGSGDDRGKVAQNRATAATQLGVVPDHLVTCHQIHSIDV